MADWLKQCGIRTVAMQSKDVHWIAVLDILEESPFRSLFGQYPRDEESAGAQKRRVGESVADEAAHVRALTKFVRPGQRSARCGPVGGSATI